MPLDFPTSPTDGQQYNGYVYSSATGAWRGKAASSSPVYTSATAPANPVAGDMWWNSNDGTMYVYYKDADAYQWVEVRSQIAKSQVGLVPVTPGTVTVATGTATINGAGVVTFAGATAISLNSVFTDSYTHYKVLFRLDNSTSTITACLRLRNAGSDDSSANYNRAGYYINVAGSLTGWTAASQTLFNIVNMDLFSGGSMFAFAELTIANPKLVTRTIVTSTALGRDSAGAWQNTTSNSIHNGGTSFDGFTFFPNGSGTFGGTVQVYGYNG